MTYISIGFTYILCETRPEIDRSKVGIENQAIYNLIINNKYINKINNILESS